MRINVENESRTSFLVQVHIIDFTERSKLPTRRQETTDDAGAKARKGTNAREKRNRKKELEKKKRERGR